MVDTYTYFVPSEMEAQIRPGILVQVGFGKNTRCSGLVSHIRETAADESIREIKPILAIETGNVKMEGSGKDLLNNPEVKRVYLGG